MATIAVTKIMPALKSRIFSLLRWSEKYTKTDMVYLAKGGFWLNLNYLFDSIFSFIIILAFAHFLSQETYGVYKYITSVAGVLVAFSLTGMKMAVIRATAQHFEGVFKKSLLKQLWWSVPQFIIFCGVGAYYLYQGNSVFGISFLAISILVPLSSIANTYAAFLQGRTEFKTLSLYGLCSNFFSFIVIGTAVIFTKNPLFLVLAYYSGRAIINIFFCWRTFITYKPNSLFREEDLSYGKHLSLMNIIGTIAAQIDNVIVFHYLGPAPVAIYNFATAIPERLKGLFGFVGTVALSRMAEKKNLEIGKSIIRKTTVLALAAALVTVCYIIVAPFLFSLLFPKYVESVLYSQIFSISMIAVASSIPIGALYAKKLQKELYLLSIIGPLLKIASFVAATFYFGLWGAIIVKVLHSFFQLLIPIRLLFGSVKNTQN